MIPNPLLWLRIGTYAAVFASGVWVGIQFQEDAYDELMLERAQNDRDQARLEAKALSEQADRDRLKLAERDKKLSEVVQNATKWREKYESALSDPVVKDWAATPHPPASGELLNSP